MTDEMLAAEISMTALVVVIYEVERDGVTFLDRLSSVQNKAIADRNASEDVRSRIVSWTEVIRKGVDGLSTLADSPPSSPP
jgi:hypothetical protein